jgi:uncharacterized protein with PIN domain
VVKSRHQKEDLVDKKELCPVCSEGYLHHEMEEIEVRINSVKHVINTKYSICDSCESEIATEDDARFNKAQVTALERKYRTQT